MFNLRNYFKPASFLALFFAMSNFAFSSEADLILPAFDANQTNILYLGLVVCVLGLGFGIFTFFQVKNLRAHKSMLDVAQLIFETAKTYLIQQGKFIVYLELLIGSIIAIYFGALQGMSFQGIALILLFSIIGILGSYSVAWFGIRVNTYANARMAFASLESKPLKLLKIPLKSGLSIGVLLICVELILMLIILLTVPKIYAGVCFIGFAIGESLGASVLRIAGGIFTKIADIGADLMKIVFNLKEDDPANPGVIADCTGDNAGDSVGPTADGFETYGVTLVALISFILLSVSNAFQTQIITWIFAVGVSMVIASIAAYYVNDVISNIRYSKVKDMDFEVPLTSLVWVNSILAIIATFAVSYWMLSGISINGQNNLWLLLSLIMSLGTLGAALIPEFTKIFTSTKAAHTREVVAASREGGASLNILSGLSAGNFSAFWKGMVFFGLMWAAYMVGEQGLSAFMGYQTIFAFGLLAFGFLSMGPVTIAVDSYGPITDNAQSIYELSLIETLPNIAAEIEKDYGFKPDFEHAKQYLEENDGAGNTFKATSKPVLIGTAVVGATTMIFSLVLVLQKAYGIDLGITNPDALKLAISGVLSLLNPFTLFGLLCGGAVIYWFTGASIQAVTTGAFQAVDFIKKNIDLNNQSASTENSKKVVQICTQYAQKGMFNIFIGVFCFTLAFAFFSAPQGTNYTPTAFFISYLMSIALFGLYQAMFMANAGGCWDNAKKIVETELKEKGTELHSACVVGDTVGDPFKDTSSVALNPIIKFTTLFGILAMEMAMVKSFAPIAPYVGLVFLLIAFYFVWRSFYKMRIPKRPTAN